jgi:hypothetical protein
LSTLFAFNGFFIGVFQVFFIKPMINLIGMYICIYVCIYFIYRYINNYIYLWLQL